MACVGRRRSHARDKGQDEDHLQVRKGGEGDCRDDAARVGDGGGGENGPLATYLSVRVKPEDFNCPESVKALLKFESRRDCKVAEIHEYVQQTARQSSHTRTRTAVRTLPPMFPAESLQSDVSAAQCRAQSVHPQALSTECTFEAYAWVACIYLTRPLATSLASSPPLWTDGGMVVSGERSSRHVCCFSCCHFVPAGCTVYCIASPSHRLFSISGREISEALYNNASTAKAVPPSHSHPEATSACLLL